jgi:hypothetical protein
MGKVGHKAQSDVLESSIVVNPHTYTQEFKNRVFEHLNKHRDALGYPKGTNTLPYFICSNDNSLIAIQFMSLVSKKGDTFKDILQDIPNILDLLIKTYDDKCTHGCCSSYHSQPKEYFVELRDKVKEILKQN